MRALNVNVPTFRSVASGALPVASCGSTAGPAIVTDPSSVVPLYAVSRTGGALTPLRDDTT